MELMTNKDARNLRELYERARGEHLDPDYAPPIDHQEQDRITNKALEVAITEAIETLLHKNKMPRTLEEIENAK